MSVIPALTNVSSKQGDLTPQLMRLNAICNEVVANEEKSISDKPAPGIEPGISSHSMLGPAKM